MPDFIPAILLLALGLLIGLGIGVWVEGGYRDRVELDRLRREIRERRNRHA